MRVCLCYEFFSCHKLQHFEMLFITVHKAKPTKYSCPVLLKFLLARCVWQFCYHSHSYFLKKNLITLFLVILYYWPKLNKLWNVSERFYSVVTSGYQFIIAQLLCCVRKGVKRGQQACCGWICRGDGAWSSFYLITSESLRLAASKNKVCFTVVWNVCSKPVSVQ
jgi:hypothetical protein